MLRTLDLFSGIGGFSLGLEETDGFKSVAFCEIDPYCRNVLAKRWPNVPIFEDVTKLKGADVGSVDVICGGFPCQDISFAGQGAGIEGDRSGLWGEFARLIGELRPRYVIVENVAALLGRGLDRVLGDLAALGFDAEWHCIPASAVGAPHRRDRVWIVAYADQRYVGPQEEIRAGRNTADAGREDDPDAAPMQRLALQRGEPDGNHARAGNVANPARVGRDQGRPGDASEGPRRRIADGSGFRPPGLANSERARLAVRQGIGSDLATQLSALERSGYGGLAGQWGVEPDVGRVADGVPARVDRLRSLGNAVVCQVVEIVGRAVLAHEARMRGIS